MMLILSWFVLPLFSSSVESLGIVSSGRRSVVGAGVLGTITVLSQLKSAKSMEAVSSSPRTCAVVGVGVLGTSLCRQLLEDGRWSTVIGFTNSDNRHATIREELGGEDTRLQLMTIDQHRKEENFDDVVLCAPPSGSSDYPGFIREVATNIWKGPQGGGSFVFTSTGAIYGPGEMNTVTETTTLVPIEENPRVERSRAAEASCLEAGGGCLRLAGLYNLHRGPHNFWLKQGKVSSGPEGLINLLHYDDAAGACLAALSRGPDVVNGNVFLISDGNPLTRREICQSALKHPEFSSMALPLFEVDTGAQGKIYDGSASNLALKWKPCYSSFDEFMTRTIGS